MARHRLLVVSNRWDSLGGRLVSLVNASAAASAVGAEFGFVWPRLSQTIDYPASALFSRDFCERYEITDPTVLDRRVRLEGRELLSMSLAEATTRCTTLEQDTAVFIDQPFAVERFGDEPPERAAKRFREAYDSLELGDQATAIKSMIARDVGTPATALHARFGDIVSGAWSQWVPREKFRPLVFFELAATQHSSDSEPIVAVSDTPAVVVRLSERVPAVRAVGDLSPGYRTLTGPARDWADLFTLLSSKRILAPSISAFSTFAALASGGELFDVLGAVPPERRVTTMLAASQCGGTTTQFDARLRARELCYLLDSDSGELSVATRRRLAIAARRSDSGYVGAHVREAAALAAAGRLKAAVEAASRAVRLAAPNTIHDDPGLEAEAALVMAGVVEAVCGRWWRRKRALQTVRAAAAAANERRPWQMHRAEIAREVEYLLRLVDVAVRPAQVSKSRLRTRRARRTLAGLTPAGSADRLPLSVWRDTEFDAVLAMLERVTLWLVDLVGAAAIARRRTAAGKAVAMHELAPSSNGVRWIEVACNQQLPARAILVEHPSLQTPTIGLSTWHDPASGEPRFLMPLAGDAPLDLDGAAPEDWAITAITW